jgi:hypothetical protein
MQIAFKLSKRTSRPEPWSTNTPKIGFRDNLLARRPSNVTGRHMLKSALRSVAVTASHCALVILCKVLSRTIPALLTRTSMAPTAASTSRTPATQASKSPASQRYTAAPVLARKAFAAASLPAYVAATQYPTLRSASDTAAPMPRVPPETSATRAILSILYPFGSENPRDAF